VTGNLPRHEYGSAGDTEMAVQAGLTSEDGAGINN
jgi:hypothetical protein